MCTDREVCKKVERIFCCPCFFNALVFHKHHFINCKKKNCCYQQITYYMASSSKGLIYLPHKFKKRLRFLCGDHCSAFMYLIKDHVCNNTEKTYNFWYKEKTINLCKKCFLYYLRSYYNYF